MNDAVRLSPNEAHAPDPQFAAHLEWQLCTALRRESRFGEPTASSASGKWRVARIAAVLVGAMAFGACGVLAAQRIQQSNEGALRLAQWQVRQEVCKARVLQATEECKRLLQMHSAGLITAEEFSAAEQRRLAAQQQLLRTNSEAEEVVLSGREPQDTLSAPLVGRRDFVTERMQLDANAARLDQISSEGHLGIVTNRHAAGMQPAAALAEATDAATDAKARTALVARKLELRATWVAGKIAAADVELLGMQAEATTRVGALRRTAERTAAAWEHAKVLAKAGQLPSGDLRAAEQADTETRAELMIAELEVAVLEEKLAGGK